MKFISSSLFTWRKVFLYTLIFGGIIILTQRALRHVCADWISLDCPTYWPISVFNIRFPTLSNIAMAVIVVLVFLLFVKCLEKQKFNLTLVILFGMTLIVGSTLIQGIKVGFYAPIAGDSRSGVLTPYSTEGQEYYHDALKISDPVGFFGRYNEIQPTLHQHGHTHPPGAVLLFYFMEKLVRNPALIAIVIMAVSTTLTCFFFHRLMRTEINDELAGYMTFLLALMAPVQIYYLATLDAVVTALLTCTLYLFCFAVGRKGIIAAIFVLTISFLLTFVSVFILPVLIGFDIIVRRSLRRSVVLIGGIIVVHIFIYLFTGYNALLSFLTASRYENPGGFMLFAFPGTYLLTRVENVAEIILFLGPFLFVLLVRGLKSFSFNQLPLITLTLLASATLLAMFLTGAWRTGETARACAFIYPYLLFPVGNYLEQLKITADERAQLAALVFGQSIAMQTFGNYYW